MTQDREITGKDGAPMVLIPAGEFWMGSPESKSRKNEQPQRQVFLDAFHMDKFEVTVVRYAEFLRSTKKSKPGLYWDRVDTNKHGNLPAIGIDWNNAEAYCLWAGKRLPTEAEWEKAARGTDRRTYPWGNEEPTARHANFGVGPMKEKGDLAWDRLAPVESYEAGKSPYGLHHMAGNAWEWTSDWYDAQYYKNSPRKNPRGPSNGDFRVRRGGAWDWEPDSMRSANRFHAIPQDNFDDFGFRCAQDSPK